MLPYQDPASVFETFASEPYALFFDSADQSHPLSRRSYICADPAEVIKANTDEKPFDRVQEKLSLWRSRIEVLDNMDGIFTGGAAGLFGYDLGRSLETLPDGNLDPCASPDLCIGIYLTVFVFDIHSRKAELFIHDTNELDAGRKAQDYKDKIVNLQKHFSYSDTIHLRPQMSKTAFCDTVQKGIDYIHAGDIFQVNLSMRFEALTPKSFDPYAHYLTMRAGNAAPFGGYFNMRENVLSSVSPEQFLTLRNGFVETRPIKGTSKKHDNPETDAQIRQILQQSEKNRAENVMIVDLLRNDLSKVCDADSIHVPSLLQVESYAAVHHMISVIKGELKSGYDAVDLLKAGFPGGSITGAPKIRAMEIIEELEAHRRGPYTGSLAMIGFDGGMQSNLLIRTVLHTNNKIIVNVGSGIVSDSKPEDEYDEILAKASGIICSFQSELKDRTENAKENTCHR